MPLRIAYEAGLAIACMLSMLAVLLGGEMPVITWAALLVPPATAIMHAKGYAANAAIGGVLGGVSMLAGALTLVLRGFDAALLGASIAMIGILVARLVTRQTIAHDMQAMLVTLLLVFAGTVVHTQITYGAMFVLYAVSAAWALVTRQLVAGAEKEALRRGGAALDNTLARRDVATPALFGMTAILAIAILTSTSVLFVLFPRVGRGRLGLLARQTGGFPSDVSLQGEPRAGGGGEVMARIRGLTFAQYNEGLYLRGPVYDWLTRNGFQRSKAPGELPKSRLAVVEETALSRYEIYTQPVMAELMLSLGPVKSARVHTGGMSNPSVNNLIRRQRGPNGELLAVRTLSGPIRYDVSGHITRLVPLMDLDSIPIDPRLSLSDPLTAETARYFLQRADEPRIEVLANQILVDAGNPEDPYRKAAAIRDFLLKNFEYTLSQPNGQKTFPLRSFLLEDRRGHCEYFATAYALLLRMVGIPSRVVGGFMGGFWDPNGNVVVFTSKNAHAWVEWFWPGRGWVVDDATPAAAYPPTVLQGLAAWLERAERFWDDHIVEYGLIEQLQLVSELYQGFRGASSRVNTLAIPWMKIGAGLGGIILILAAYLFRRRRGRGHLRRQHALAMAIQRALERVLGEPVSEAATLRRAVEEPNGAIAPDTRALLIEALEVYEADRFGGHAPRGGEVHRLQRALERIRPAP